MARILLFVVLAFIVWLAVRVVGSRRRTDDPAADRSDASGGAIETVAQCAWCGVHVPAAAARALPDGRVYCGDAHRDAARAISVAE